MTAYSLNPSASGNAAHAYVSNVSRRLVDAVREAREERARMERRIMRANARDDEDTPDDVAWATGQIAQIDARLEEFTRIATAIGDAA